MAAELRERVGLSKNLSQKRGSLSTGFAGRYSYLWHFFTLIYIMASQKLQVPLLEARSINVAVHSIAHPEKQADKFKKKFNFAIRCFSNKKNLIF